MATVGLQWEWRLHCEPSPLITHSTQVLIIDQTDFRAKVWKKVFVFSFYKTKWDREQYLKNIEKLIIDFLRYSS